MKSEWVESSVKSSIINAKSKFFAASGFSGNFGNK